jgi:hypothetical protein
VDSAKERGAYRQARSGIITVMKHTRLPWLLSLPLMAGGCLGAHSAAYGLFDPVAEPAHGYLAVAPLLLAIALAVGIVAAIGAVVTGRTRTGAPIHLFALLPPLAFMLQEHLERALHGAGAFETALEPAFVLGLVLQLPFALCSFVAARILLRVAEEAGALFVRRLTLSRRPAIVRRPRFLVDAPGVSALASRHAGRAPPHPA